MRRRRHGRRRPLAGVVARSRSVATVDVRAEFDEVRDFYRRRLTAPIVRESFRWEPVCIGPTWQRDGDRWLLPESSLGWEFLAWTGVYLQAGRDEPWVWTDEQARFLLWWYSVDPVTGRFLFRDGVMQRLKGHGKDPLGAGIASFELVGPNQVHDFGDDGQPVGRPHDDPWVQVAAVSLEQTKNTMRLLPSLVSPRAMAEFQLMIGKESAYAGNRFLQAVTSSPATLQGARSTFVLLNETHEWVSSNGGHDMEYVLQNNSTKSKGGFARTLRITNAYEPGADSVAEHDRDAYEAVQAGRATDTGLLYDSLEAAPDAPLTIDAAPEVVRSIRGDSTWLDIDRIVSSIADVRNPASRSRRFWYNQIVASEDAWLTPQQVDACATDEKPQPGDKVFIFVDGSKSDDATAAVGCRLSDGLVFTVGVWQRPPRLQPGEDWTVDRAAVDRAVRAARAAYDVVGLWGDPSDARDDNTGERFWEPIFDEWANDLHPPFEAVRSGDQRHAVIWDMRDPRHLKLFTEECERFATDVASETIRHDSNPLLVQHLKNARRRPNKWGVSVGKEHRESRKKIDAGVCAVGARLMRRLYLASSAKPKRAGRLW